MKGAVSVLGFIALHFYTQLVLCPAHIVFGLLTGLVNPYGVTRHLCEVMGIKFLKTKTSHELSSSEQRRVLYLCNHRSWADFFVDQAICGGASYLARLMVWVGTPISSLYAWMSHSTWYFKRQRGIDRAAFAKFMEDEWIKRPTYGMIAYPEGTRNQANEPLPLKTGVLQFAYEYKHPVQCVITTGKEQIVNEKRLTFGPNRAVITDCSELIDPAKFETLESFVAKVREAFASSWKSAYTTTEEDAVPYNPPMGATPPKFESACEPGKIRTLRIATLLLVLLAIGGRYSSRIS